MMFDFDSSHCDRMGFVEYLASVRHPPVVSENKLPCALMTVIEEGDEDESSEWNP